MKEERSSKKEGVIRKDEAWWKDRSKEERGMQEET
jgi:hypothetical protein